MRIALVTETFSPEVNGVAMTMGRIVSGLASRGHHVQLVRPRQAHEHEDIQRSDIEQVLVAGMPVPNYPDLRFGYPAKNKLLQLWRDQRPDIVHVVTEGPLGWSAIAAAKRLNLPLSSSFHTNFQSYSQHYGIGFFKAMIDTYLRWFHNCTQVTMVPTQALILDLQSRGYNNVKLLSRGIDVALFSPAKRSQDLRSSWGASQDDLAVLLVGRLAKEKNAELVVRAFQAIKQKSPRAKLIFVGDGPLRKALQTACPEAIFTGNRKGEDLAAHYASADLFLFPSLTETYGNVVPEALASGLAVVSYAHAAAKDLIQMGVNGMQVAFNDEPEFVRIAVQVATDPNFRAAIRSHAAQSVAHLGWDDIYDSFEGHLVEVLAQQHTHPAHHAQRINASPMLMRDPCASPSDNLKPLGASTMTVEPC